MKYWQENDERRIKIEIQKFNRERKKRIASDKGSLKVKYP